MPTTDYDAIAEDYRRAKRQRWRACIEASTLLARVGDVADKAVVDLACGEGHYTRLLKRGGASKAVGVDLSAEMIALARAEEEARPLGVEYLVRDCKDPGLDGGFDLVVAAYLLNYARNRDELKAMCRGARRCLEPGGRFVAINTNPGLEYGNIPSYRPYGFDVEPAGAIEEGSPIAWTFHLEGGPLRVENYYLGVDAHEEALIEAGFREVRWHRPRLAPDGERAEGYSFWAAFLEHPPIIFIECLT